ncbi:helix-turn-helix domain-containing protein [Streptomyces sp. NPDC048361]|uniref:helix-turn-helix domain-containing protein n=1 Tax=Streptomyces sp. NPDC048361 TaxID=3154720 RepID=UPI0034160F37
MAQWQPLPESTRPELRLLIEELRHLKQSSGLSLAGLAARTTYSKSAWHRYLHGDNLPPRDAVDAFGALGGAEHHARLLELWDLAVRPPRPRIETPGNPGNPAGPAGTAGPADLAGTVGPARPVRPAGPVTRPAPATPVTTLAAPPSPEPPPASPARRTHLRTFTIAAALALIGSAAWAAVPHASHATSHATPTPAAPAASACGGAGCQGADPARSACRSDARTQSALTTASYAVKLRFSPSCDTIWSEVRSSSTGADTESPMLVAPDPRQAEACAEVGRTMLCTGHTQAGP